MYMRMFVRILMCGYDYDYDYDYDYGHGYGYDWFIFDCYHHAGLVAQRPDGVTTLIGQGSRVSAEGQG
jgi:hypothetical protein